MNKNNLDQKLRYNDGGNVHMDFHGATNTTIEFIINKYGIDTMNDIFKKVGNDVYKDIKDHIKNAKVSRISYGIPIGGELEYVDANTIARAIQGRIDLS